MAEERLGVRPVGRRPPHRLAQRRYVPDPQLVGRVQGPLPPIPMDGEEPPAPEQEALLDIPAEVFGLPRREPERFERPAFALGLNGAMATGSARSIAGVDIGRVVRAAVEAGLAIKGGGHAMAAGVTLARARLGDFRAFLEEQLAAPVATAQQACLNSSSWT